MCLTKCSSHYFDPIVSIMNSQNVAATNKEDLVELVVGGITYTVTTADIQKYPESFFAALLKKEWKPSDNTSVTIERDGVIFRYIFAFLVAGHLPRKPDGTISLDATTLSQVRVEADFYNLPALVEECDTNVAPTDFVSSLAAYSTIRSYVSTMKSLPYLGDAVPTLECEYSSENPTDLVIVNVLASVWAPFCVKGKISHGSSFTRCKLYKSTTMTVPNVPELLAEAQQSAFGRGTETIVDTTVRNSVEIPASHLHPATLAKIAKSINLRRFAPKMKLEVRPHKLVIYQEGGHFDQHRDTVRGDNQIGTLVVILNSEYTGGELEISHGGKAAVVTGPYSWVAMYGDCLHKINPVTSGTRVSLIYDLYAEPTSTVEADQDNNSDVDNSDNDSDNGDENGDGDVDECHIGDDEVNNSEDRDDEGDGDGDGDGDNIDNGDEYGDFYVDSSDNGDDDGEEGELAQFLENTRAEKAISADTVRIIDENHQQLIFDAVDRELAGTDTVVICLAHKYPTCQSTPYFLKGGDLALYELLKDRYDVTVEPVSVLTTFDEDTREGEISAALVKDVAAKVARTEQASKKRKVSAVVKLVIPSNLNADSVLDYSPYIEHTGNESQQAKTVYVVAGLQVRKR